LTSFHGIIWFEERGMNLGFGRYLVALVALLVAFGQMHGALAASPAAYCQQAGTDDTLRSVPTSLVPVAVKLFQLEAMPAEQVQRSTYFRCSNHHVLVCHVGANLPCGKADTRRALPSVDAWCADHAGSQDVPAYVTGHATIYQWRCDGTRAVASGSALSVDDRGFVAQYWKQVGSE
jgi:hypothetical protein